jgi:hypothetical protein
MTEQELNELIELEKKASKSPWKRLGTVSVVGRRKGIFETTPKNRKAEQDIDFVVALRNAFPDIVEVLKQHTTKGESK